MRAVHAVLGSSVCRLVPMLSNWCIRYYEPVVHLLPDGSAHRQIDGAGHFPFVEKADEVPHAHIDRQVEPGC